MIINQHRQHRQHRQQSAIAQKTTSDVPHNAISGNAVVLAGVEASAATAMCLPTALAMPPINLWNYYTLWHNAEYNATNSIESRKNIAE